MSKQAVWGMCAVVVRILLVTIEGWSSLSQELNLNDLEVLLVSIIHHEVFMFA